MIINIIIFIVMAILDRASIFQNLSNNILSKFGGNLVSKTLNGDYYRLITSAFLHANLIHLLCNTYSLFMVGPTVEYFYGKFKFILIYLYSAITASLFVLMFHGTNVIAVGASGAIFGLLGALLYFGYKYRGYIGNRIIGSVISVIVLNLFIGFTLSGISNYAHIGGLIGGLAISYMLGVDNNDKKSTKISGIIIFTLLTGFLVYMAFFR